MIRDEWIEAGAQAVADTGEVLEGDFYGVRDLVGVVLDAVEPLIRTDERREAGVITILEGSSVAAFMAALGVLPAHHPVYRLRIWPQEDGTVKFKINEEMWTQGLGKAERNKPEIELNGLMEFLMDEQW